MILGFAAAMLSAPTAVAVTQLPSGDGQFWDIQDTSAWAQDSGGIATGGRANPFNGFGYLKLQVQRSDGTVLTTNQYLRGFGLAYDGGERLDSITPVLVEGVLVSRAIYAPKDKQYLRYFDSYLNAANEDRIVDIAWGGACGAYEDGGKVSVATTSTGDQKIDVADSFVVVMQNADQRNDVGARRQRIAEKTSAGYGSPCAESRRREPISCDRSHPWKVEQVQF